MFIIMVFILNHIERECFQNGSKQSKGESDHQINNLVLHAFRT